MSKPTIGIFAHANLSHQVERAESFRRGLMRHGYNAKVYPTSTPVPCDLAVFWGMHHSRGLRQQQEQRGLNWLIMERGYVGDRFHWTSLGYNGLNGRADFLNKGSPGDRWEKYFKQYMKPWKSYVNGDYILLTGQVSGDASLAAVNGRVDYDAIIGGIRAYWDGPIHFRPHPQRPIPAPRDTILSTGTLTDAFSKAHVTVTYNSNTAVDSVLAGIPAIVMDRVGCMAGPVCGDDLYEIILGGQIPDRTQWAHDIAYTQWSPEEIENGDAWEHLKGKFE